MILILFLGSFSLSIGAELDYVMVGDFNNHFRFLEDRALVLGWEGDMGRFRNFQFSPVMQLQLFDIEGLSLLTGIGYFFDHTSGEFTYNYTVPNVLELNEKWGYDALPVQFQLGFNLAGLSLTSGVEFMFSQLEINAVANYDLHDNYPKKYKSDDVGLVAGIKKSMARCAFELFFRSTPIDRLRNQQEFLHYDTADGYIYEGPELEGSRNAKLDLSGIGIKVLYRVF